MEVYCNVINPVPVFNDEPMHMTYRQVDESRSTSSNNAHQSPVTFSLSRLSISFSILFKNTLSPSERLQNYISFAVKIILFNDHNSQHFSTEFCYSKLTSGTRKASLKLRLAATEKMGSTQLKRAPIRIIFPVCGSRGNLAKWKPRGVRLSSASTAFRFSSNCQRKHAM